jgi:hypothetical protein
MRPINATELKNHEVADFKLMISFALNHASNRTMTPASAVLQRLQRCDV